MNVRINLEFIEGDDVDRLSSQIDKVVYESTESAEAISLKVNERLGW